MLFGTTGLRRMLRGGESERLNAATQDILEAYRLELNSETSHKTKRGFIRSLLRLAKPYYITQDNMKEKAVGWALLVTTLGLAAFQVIDIAVGFNQWNKAMGSTLQQSFNALSMGPEALEAAWNTFSERMRELAILSGKSLAVGYANYKMGQHAIRRLRRFITKDFEEKYRSNKVYYHMQNKSNPLDHPDQRIQEDPAKVAEVAFDLVNDAFDAAISFVTFSAILWGVSESQAILGVEIPKFMFTAVMGYSAIGTALSYFGSKPLERHMMNQQKFEADYRSDLKELHEKREAIALNDGEVTQAKVLDESYDNLDNNMKKVIGVNSYLLGFRIMYNRLAGAVPLVVTFPQIVAGKMDLGGYFEVAGAFSEVKNAMSWYVNNAHKIRSVTAYMNRLIDTDDENTAVQKEQIARAAAARAYIESLDQAEHQPSVGGMS